MALYWAVWVTLLTPCAIWCARNPSNEFQPCEEKSGIVQGAKATALAAKMVDRCFLSVGSKYKYSPSMFQRGARKMCLVLLFCFHKYKDILNAKGMEPYGEAVYSCIAKIGPLLTVQLNPEFVDEHVVNATGMFVDAVECVSKNKIFTDDVAVSLALMKWILKTLF